MFSLRKRAPIEVFCPVFQPDRKNLAVHVSLSSIFTISKSRPRDRR
jgi:hypothetical protein